MRRLLTIIFKCNGRWRRLLSILGLCLLIAVPFSSVFSRSSASEIKKREGTVHRPLPIKKYRLILSISHDLRLPSDVSVGPRGWIYVLDGTQDVIRIYNPKGKPLFTLGGRGKLNMPLGLDVAESGEVVVADSGSHRLAIFPPGVNEPRYIPVPSPPMGRPSDPTDVVVAPHSNRLITVDNDNHRVVALDRDGEVIWSTGVMGRGAEEFRFPFLMDMDDQGRIYIVEVINTRVQVLDMRGKFAGFIGSWGIDPGQFFRPKGVAVNKNGEVFVSDSYVGVVQIFKSNGDFVGAVGHEDGKLWRFETPVGLSARGNRLYVVEMIKNRVLVLEALDH